MTTKCLLLDSSQCHSGWS